jgi:maleate isomerase
MPQEASKLRRETKVENKGSAGGDQKLGLIIPCTNITMEAEFNRVLLPKNITVHSTRLKRSTTDLTTDTLTEMERSLEEAMSLLSMIDIDVMVFGCTSGSLFLGLGWDQKIIKRMKKQTQAAVTTTATSVIEALKSLNLRKIAVITPYIDTINTKEKNFLESHGFKVAFIDGFHLLDSIKIREVTEKQIVDFMEKFSFEHVDGIFISCTSLRTFNIIDHLENKYNIPVVTSNQASLWNALRILDRREKFDTLGQLCAEI